MVYSPIDHLYDIKIFKYQVEPQAEEEWIHC